MKLFAISRGGTKKRLLVDFYFEIDNCEIKIPAGYEWNGATGAGRVTRFFVGLNRFGDMDEATLKHDFIYSKEGDIPGFPRHISRKETDQLFRSDLILAGFNGLRLDLIYNAVRLFGYFLWKE